jgi:hypothetical protein
MTNNQLFAAALGITAPWFVQTVDFDAGQRRLTVHVDFAPGSRFAHPKAPGDDWMCCRIFRKPDDDAHCPKLKTVGPVLFQLRDWRLWLFGAQT